jgi:hypothetical protein
MTGAAGETQKHQDASNSNTQLNQA